MSRGDVDGVAVGESDVGECLSPDGEFAGQGLGDPGEVREEPQREVGRNTERWALVLKYIALLLRRKPMMRSKIEVRAVCPGCGPMVVPAEDFRCELEAAGRDGICELRCPVCSTTILLPAVALAVETLWRAGAGHMGGIAPFELLEPHTGPPLSWDDVLDFKLALENDSYSQPEAEV